jgi:NADPH:quinone reductase
MPLHVVANQAGGPEVLELVDEPDRDPGPGEVAIEVRAAGVNPIDYKVYSGNRGPAAPFPMHLGWEAAGVVLAVGADAVGPRGPISAGDEVIAYRIGDGYSERTVVTADAVVPKPEDLPWAEASGLMLVGVTAIHALAAVHAAEGDTVLFHGAAGGVGITAIQLARARGARVLGTASEANHEFLRSLGAEPITYGAGLLERVQEAAPEGIDAVIDGVGTPEALEVSLAVVRDLDRVATIVASPAAFDAGVKVLGGAPGADPGTEIRVKARLELVDRVSAGELAVFVARTYPLAEVGAAHRELMAGHVRGKLALIP